VRWSGVDGVVDGTPGRAGSKLKGVGDTGAGVVGREGGAGVTGGDSWRPGSHRVRHAGDLMNRGRISPAISFSAAAIIGSNMA
jgi:hypothetical protein